MSAPHAIQYPNASALGRRRFIPGMAALTAGLGAGLVAVGPQWGEGAPARPDRAAPGFQPSLRSMTQPGIATPPLPAPPAPRVLVHSARLRQDWLAFRHQYVTPEGRVIDTGNGNTSHSEGQGWGLMGAQAADDPDTFATHAGMDHARPAPPRRTTSCTPGATSRPTPTPCPT